MARPRKADRDPKKQIGAYPPPEVRPAIYKLADTLGRSDGDFVAMCAVAVCEMVESANLEVPQLVTTLRVLREAKAGMNAPKRPFPGHERRDIKEVSNGYPAHKVPLYPRITAGPPVDGLGEVEEWIDVPAGRFRYVDFAVRVEGDSMFPTIKPGVIALFVKAPTAENTQIVAAYFPKEGKVCLKRYKTNGTTKLVSDNPTYAPIDAKEAKVQGIFVGSL